MKKIFATMAMAAFAAGAFAQGIYIYKTDGSRLGFKYNEIEKIEAYLEDDEPSTPMVNDVELTADASFANVLSATVDLKKGQSVTIKGIPSVDAKIQPAYFSGAGGSYTFNAADGKYKIMYNTEYDLVWTQFANDDWTKNYYPHCVWSSGPGVGHPGSNGSVPSAWGWDQPNYYACLVATADNVFEGDYYFEAGFQLRFYKGHGDWGNPFNANVVDTYPAYWCHWAGDDIKSENFGPGPDFTPGIYHVRLDLNENICYFTRK